MNRLMGQTNISGGHIFVYFVVESDAGNHEIHENGRVSDPKIGNAFDYVSLTFQYASLMNLDQLSTRTLYAA